MTKRVERPLRGNCNFSRNVVKWVGSGPAVFVDFDVLPAVLSVEEARPHTAGQSPEPDSRLSDPKF